MRKRIIIVFISVLTIISAVFAIDSSFSDREIDYYMGDYYSYWDGCQILCDQNYDDYGYSFDLVQTAWKVEVEVFGGSCNYSKTFYGVSSGEDIVDVDDGKKHWFYIRTYFYAPVAGGCAGTWSAFPIEEEQ